MGVTRFMFRSDLHSLLPSFHLSFLPSVLPFLNSLDDVLFTFCLFSTLSTLCLPLSLGYKEPSHPAELTCKPPPERTEVLKMELLEFRCLTNVPQEGNVQV